MFLKVETTSNHQPTYCEMIFRSPGLGQSIAAVSRDDRHWVGVQGQLEIPSIAGVGNCPMTWAYWTSPKIVAI